MRGAALLVVLHGACVPEVGKEDAKVVGKRVHVDLLQAHDVGVEFNQFFTQSRQPMLPVDNVGGQVLPTRRGQMWRENIVRDDAALVHAVGDEALATRKLHDGSVQLIIFCAGCARQFFAVIPRACSANLHFL